MLYEVITQVVDLLEEDDKFIATETRQGVRMAYVFRQSNRHFAQHPVPQGMPHGIVDGLETINIEEEQNDLLAGTTGFFHRVLKPIMEQRNNFV